MSVQFWYLMLSMELTVFMLIRSFREVNFSLYCQALKDLMPYFFANNNTIYARWLPVHLRDMLTLESRHPEVDQAHEQVNAVIKGDGGAIGLTENPSALRSWIVSGPEVSHLVSLYETEAKMKEANDHSLHHELTPHAQQTFFDRVQKHSQVLQDLGNPFQEDSTELFTIDSKDVAHPSSAELS